MQELSVIDENDNIIGKDTRENIHKNGLLHRGVSVWLYNPKGEIIFQKRSANKDIYPGLLASSVGGGVDLGENYEEAGIRELKEESGITAIPKDLILLEKMRRNKTDKVTGGINNTFTAVFAYRFDGYISDLKIEEGKADGFEFWHIDKILNISDDDKRKFIPSIFDDDYKNIFNKIKELSEK